MVEGVAWILTLLWKLAWSSWSVAKYCVGPVSVSNDHRCICIQQMREEPGPGKLVWGSAFRDV